jgi:hypothetical protein
LFGDYFSICKSASWEKDEKYSKKVLARNQKSSTFAPAFGRNEWQGRGETKAKSSLKV